MQWESKGIQPDIDDILGEGGYGLVQWTPGTILLDWAEERGLDFCDIRTQCERIQWELENNVRYIKSKCSYTNFSEFSKSEDSPEELAYCFMTEYQRPNESDSHLYDRQQYAKYWNYYFTNDISSFNYTYQIRTENKTFSDLIVSNNESYAEVTGEAIANFAIKVNIGIVNYQVHVIGKGWSRIARQFNWSNDNDGYSGTGERIDKIKIYFDGEEQPYYRVARIGENFSGWQYGNLEDAKKGFKGYAGEDNVPIEKIQIIACKPKNRSFYENFEDEEFKCIYDNGGNVPIITDRMYSEKLDFKYLLLLLLILI